MSLLDWAVIFSIVAILANTISISIAIARCRPRRTALASPSDAPPVSIVRPLCGLDNFSAETLGSCLVLDYPAYEVIFGVARATDPVIPLVERLMKSHPAVPCRLIIGDEPISANPKLNNCVRGWNAARHEWIVLADANLLMPRDYLQRLLASWRPNTGLVSSAPVGSRPCGFWAEVECAFLNTLQARWQFVGEQLGLGFAQGKTLLFRRALLEQAGGLPALADEPAEDAAATKLIGRCGLRVHLVDMPFEQPLGWRSAAEVCARQLRWARLRRATFPMFFLPEILTGPILPVLAGSTAAIHQGWYGSMTALAVLLFWYLPEMLLAKTTGWHFTWRSPLTYLARDVVMPTLWVMAWLGSDFTWRGSSMTVREADT